MASMRLLKQGLTNLNSIVIELLEQNKLKEVPKQYRIKLEKWIMEKNKKYIFKMTEYIEIPDKKDIFNITFLPLPTYSLDNDSSPLKIPPSITLEGWQLTKDGKLIQGATGYFIDETGLYILKDGRRVTNAEKYKELRIGDEDIFIGLSKILGCDLEYTMFKDTYNTLELLKNYGAYMDEVVFQAFQINICYKTKYNNTFLETSIITYKNCQFKSIGTDETGIPIVVTRVGQENASKKIVIAGPHGDERNAQRLIMFTQKYFTKRGPPDDTVIYFIPCLSPTMAFADARGIPIVNDKGNWNGKDAKDSMTKTLKDYSSNKKTIPDLHDLIAKHITRYLEGKDDKKLLRTLIQSYNGTAFNNYYEYKNNKVNENYPFYGIDANRDVRRALPSTQCFERFVFSLGEKTNINVFMIHGYTKYGDVFGPYYLNIKEKVRMTDKVKNYVNYILNTIIKNNYSFHNYETSLKDTDKDGDSGFYFQSTQDNPYNYAGEWSYLLYGIKKEKGEELLCFDIELPEIYRQGTRDDDNKENNSYNSNDVGKISLPFFQDNRGIIVKGRKSFYELLENYFSTMDNVGG
jgi:hypothetical protein